MNADKRRWVCLWVLWIEAVLDMLSLNLAPRRKEFCCRSALVNKELKL